jgi:hypothetical protein
LLGFWKKLREYPHPSKESIEIKLQSKKTMGYWAGSIELPVHHKDIIAHCREYLDEFYSNIIELLLHHYSALIDWLPKEYVEGILNQYPRLLLFYKS